MHGNRLIKEILDLHNFCVEIVSKYKIKTEKYTRPNEILEEIMASLSENPNITWDHVVANPQLKWRYGFLSRNPNITLDIVAANPKNRWDDFYLLRNQSVTFDQILRYRELKLIDMYISINPNITWQNVIDYPDINWDYGLLSSNTNITTEIVEENAHLSWSKICMHQNPSIKFDYEYHLEFSNTIFSIIDNGEQEETKGKYNNPSITAEAISKLPKSHHWDFLALHVNTTWDIVVRYQDKINWVYSLLSKNPNIKWDHVCLSPDKPWDFYNLSGNPNITWDHVAANPDKDWSFYSLSGNPNIEPKHVFDNISYRWDIYQLAENPNFSTRYIKKFINLMIEKYEIYHQSNLLILSVRLSKNKFCRHPHFQSPQYRRRMVKQRHDQMYSELIARACHPSRIFSWNEGAADEMPEEYAEECRRWREIAFWSPLRLQ
jgi:hypothetical protein